MCLCVLENNIFLLLFKILLCRLYQDIFTFHCVRVRTDVGVYVKKKNASNGLLKLAVVSRRHETLQLATINTIDRHRQFCLQGVIMIWCIERTLSILVCRYTAHTFYDIRIDKQCTSVSIKNILLSLIHYIHWKYMCVCIYIFI